MYFSTTIISDLIHYASSKGMDDKILRNKFPIPENLKQTDYETVINLLNYIGKELNDEYLGLHIGEQLSLKVTAYVDRIVQHSRTLEEAFENAAYYSRIISDALECSLIKKEAYYAVVFEENPNWEVQQAYGKRQILDLTLLSCLNSLIAYTQKQYFPIKINFSTEKPKNINEYYRLFNCQLKFNQAVTEIVFEKQIFDHHSKRMQYGLLENLKEKVAREIEGLSVENELIYQLKKSILQHKPQRIKIEDAAQALNLSKRTLQRKLNALGVTFKSVEKELLLKLAKTYLEEEQKSVEEISYLLGFSESSAFIRFFKSQMQQTPGEYVKK